MKRKFFYVIALICCVNLFSSARQMAVGSKKEYSNATEYVSKKKCSTKIKPSDSKGQRPFNFFLINI